MVSKKSRKMVSKKSRKMVSKKSKSKKSKTSRGGNNMYEKYLYFVLQKFKSDEYQLIRENVMEQLQERKIDYAKSIIRNFIRIILTTNDEFQNQHYASKTKEEIYDILTHKIYISL
jgi:hypothetical protein